MGLCHFSKQVDKSRSKKENTDKSKVLTFDCKAEISGERKRETD